MQISGAPSRPTESESLGMSPGMNKVNKTPLLHPDRRHKDKVGEPLAQRLTGITVWDGEYQEKVLEAQRDTREGTNSRVSHTGHRSGELRVREKIPECVGRRWVKGL